ncbi:glutaminase GtaA [Ephemerocybe angulata]|uniref:Glutaminase GtaA n=1 Tax=Ephemerocybe angulata TaxID=980116 RepID=A0A8H6I6H7_9AGAR|nr:glutaminase GtaA [Tulosesus angulatus]
MLTDNSEWIASDLQTKTRSTTTRGNTAVYHSTTRSEPSQWAEDKDIAGDETLVLAAPNSNSLTTQVGANAGLKGDFDKNGHLSNAVDSTDTPISPAYPAAAFALDLGNVINTPTPSPAIFALGIVRDPVISYNPGSTSDWRRPYWTTRWDSLGDAVSDFISDYPLALDRAKNFDAKAMAAARTAASPQYADLVAMSVRQLYASIDITTGKSSDGKVNVQGFMKDVGGSRRVNPVEALYASLPSILYVNSSLAAILLDPLLESQASSGYQHDYAAPDLGRYHSTPIHLDRRLIVLPDSASMLIMSWLYTQKSGNGLLIDRYYGLLKRWADGLVTNALSADAGYTTSDGLTTKGNSNVALKGILGIYAMGEITKALESRGKQSATADHYSNLAKSMYIQWETVAFQSGRMSSEFSQSSSWTLGYNIYAATLMGADLVGKNVLDGQTSFYSSQFSSSGSKLGLGFDSNAEYIVKSHWSLFAAGAATSTTVRDSFISGVWSRTFMKGRISPFSTTWDLRSGASPPNMTDGSASAITDFQMSRPTFNSDGLSGDGSKQQGKKVSAGAIAGGIVGGLAVILALILLAIFLARRRRQKQIQEDDPDITSAFTPAPESPRPATVAESPSFFTRLLGARSSRATDGEAAMSPFLKAPLHSSRRVYRMSPHRSEAPQPYPTRCPQALKARVRIVALSSIGMSQEIPSHRPVLVVLESPATPIQGPPGLLPVDSPPNDDLRAEVIELRRQMAEIQARTMGSTDDFQHRNDEPPPSYS